MAQEKEDGDTVNGDPLTPAVVARKESRHPDVDRSLHGHIAPRENSSTKRLFITPNTAPNGGSSTVARRGY